MTTRPKPTLNLRSLILIFVLFSAVATLANSFWVMFKIQKQELIENALDANQAYAARIARSVEQVLNADLDKLKYGSAGIGKTFGDNSALTREAKRLVEQDASFNSVLVADANGTIVASAPGSLQLNGRTLQHKEPLSLRTAKISNAFRSITGNLVVFISHPIFDVKGQYLGLIGGTIRLEQSNTLQALMDTNVRKDGAHFYLIDGARRVLYHNYPEQIGSVRGADLIADASLKEAAGTLQAVDEHGVEMLAGFAQVPSSGWGVISQQPLENIQAVLRRTMIKIAQGIAPLGLFGIILIWWLGTRISAPLSRLADCAKRLDTPDSYARISAVPARYFESWQIRRALLLGATLLQEKIGKLNQQAHTDTLTGLANRRAMQDVLSLWQEAGKAFAVVSIDIDHFKRVNDTFGHGVGDETLRAVAQLMQQNSRANDLPCRVGGEEFVLLLPGSSLHTAADVAQRLRASIEAASIETVGHVTVSLGVALWRADGESIAAVLERADQLLYQAKQGGRNRVVVEPVPD
ncbi:sensor domain-containing diguanylate cyclase [Pseudomonas rhodesiae]|uniref:sensor domain-containing diguanylate cyclase n=1 Tax=Pseudomonas rhodesiae TaxID=76760 RepID=UPI00209ED57E|nr:sensor domain-containing diguanylate cyclase [Pseudomonas rhodesiae]MCP1512308.1 diguanylate cyclase (GGDEF)-like protein [Pseudomonas rhodesiae]MDF9771148.1 diguanylate cyclase (GGDEF)-like protein [Pseudomonas rhodesiae]